MNDIGTPPELAWLPTDKLDVDHAYQRTLDSPASQKLIKRIAENFAWMRFQAILATPGKPGRWLVIDGQHRAAAARLRQIMHLPAVVIATASVEEQAAAFIGANKDRVTVSAQAMFHARLAAGDADAVAIARLCAAAGIGIERSNKAVKQLAAGRTAAVSVLFAIRQGMGEATLAEAIAAVGERCRGQPGALSGALFRGAATFLRERGSTGDLRAALARFDLRRLEDINKLGHNSGGRAVADALHAGLARHAPLSPAAAPPKPRVATAPPLRPDPRSESSRHAPAAVPPKRAREQDDIARFLAEKGATKLPGVGDPALRDVAELVWDKTARKWVRPARVPA